MINNLDMIARKYNTDKRSNDNGATMPYHGYTNMYELLLSHKRDEYKTILEIGVAEGASHKMWYEYFPNAMIYGIDNFHGMSQQAIDTRIAHVDNERIKTFVGDQTDGEFLQSFLPDTTFDLIIDDGGHGSWQHQISFRYLFPRLKSGCYYIIEDLATCLMREFREHDDLRSSSIEWLKSIQNNVSPFSYYIPQDEHLDICEQIGALEFVGELALILKK